MVTVSKELGRYYTPRPIAEALARWAIHDSEDPYILDPSFGECIFIETAFEALKEAGFEDYLFRVCGVDIDAKAVKSLVRFIELGAPRDHFLTSDFFSVTRESWSHRLFSAVIGNPPYVRHHYLPYDLRERAQNAVQAHGFSLPRTASYWAYFVLHSLALLRDGGRLGMVLPGAFLHADYAVVVRKNVFSSFRQVQVVLIGERVFPDAEEETILLLAEGWGRRNVNARVIRVNRMQDLQKVTDIGNPYGARCSEDSPSMVSSLLGKDVLNHYHAVLKNPAMAQLGTLVRTSIGVVTGCNGFFIRRPSFFRSRQCLMPFTRTIITSSALFAGIDFTRDDMVALVKTDNPCMLVCLPSQGPLPNSAQELIQEGKDKGIDKRTQCTRRTPWYALALPEAPNAFLTYMSGYAPRIIVNSAKVLSTNSVHHLRPKVPGTVPRLEILAVGALTTPFQLSAELNARSYGGGVLKVEPSEASRLWLPVLDSTVLSPSLFAELDAIVRTSGIRTATEVVDHEILVKKMGFPSQTLRELRIACDLLREYRISRKRRSCVLRSDQSLDPA